MCMETYMFMNNTNANMSMNNNAMLAFIMS